MHCLTPINSPSHTLTHPLSPSFPNHALFVCHQRFLNTSPRCTGPSSHSLTPINPPPHTSTNPLSPHWFSNQPCIVCLSPAFSQYVASMYWSFFTLFGVGFGDIHAVNTGERFFSVVVMMIGTIFQGAIISKVTIEGCCPYFLLFFDNSLMHP